MKLLVIIATVVAFTRAAPMSELLHPSPVNPDVLVDIKPQEKIILMTDPIEIGKFKRETKQPLYPTVSPTEINYHRSKREHERPNQQKKPRDPLALQKPQPPKKPSANQRNRREVEPVKVTQTLPAATGGPIVVEIYQKPLVLPATTEAPVTQTSTANNQKPNENDTKEDKVEEVTTEKSTRVQGLPAIFSPSKKQKRDVNKPQNPTEAPKESSNEKQTHQCKPEEISQHSKPESHQQHKRDIPVPLVPKHHHPEESPKESNEKVESHHESLEVQHDLHHRQEHDSPAVFQKPQILPAIIEESTTEAQQHKRDIPVPLVPKHHHPEESPKESNEKDSHEDSHHVHEHVAPAGFQKPQILPALIQEPTPESQQHKRDIPVPLVPKHHHPEESPKEGHENSSHGDSHQIQEHVAQDGFQKPQLLPAVLNKSPEEVQQHKRDIPVPLVPKHQHPEESPKESNEKDPENNHDSEVHISHAEFQKPQILPAILPESPLETQHKRDIPVPLVPKHHHSEESLKDGNVKETSEDIKNTEPESHHTQEGFQKPQVLPAILTETSADTQHKRDISVPINAEQHQQEQSLKPQLHDEKNSENHHNFPQLPHTLSADMQGEQPQAVVDHKDKNEKVADTQPISQTLPAHIPHYQHHQHTFPQQQTNPENHVASIPIIHKFQPKEHSDYHHLNVENHNFHQSLMAQNNQHVAAGQNHNLQVHNQDHLAATNLQNSQIPLGHQNAQVHNPENTQVVSNHNQEHVEHSGFPKPLTIPTISQHHDVLQTPQPQPTLPMLHQQHDGLQKPEVQPAVNSQIKRDTSSNSDSVQQADEHKREDEHKSQDHHPKPDEVQVEALSETKPLHQSNLHHLQLTHSNYQQHIPNHPNPSEVQVEDLSEPKPLQQQHHHHRHLTHSQQQQNTEHVPNPDEVQVEDLSEPKPLHQGQVHHMQQTNSEHKPNILDDHLSAYNVQSSTTTEHPVIRHRPVSVAELFSRPHDN